MDIEIQGEETTINRQVAGGTAEQASTFLQAIHISVAVTQLYGHHVVEEEEETVVAMQIAGVPIPAASGWVIGTCGTAENKLGDLVEIMCWANAGSRLIDWSPIISGPDPPPFQIEMFTSTEATPLPCDDTP